MGTGTHFSTVSGTLRGWGTAKISGIFGGKIPEKPQISGWGRGQQFRGISGTLRGRGQSKILGIFEGFLGNPRKIPESDQMPS